MNLGQLREATKDLPDNTLLFMAGGDHNYVHAHVGVSTILADFKNNEYVQDFGEAKTPEKDFGKRVTAVIIE